ncbi:related to forkhead protein [Cephalotrichum gorgonifer]|uniref:Related to forkhead protein n=1 Tax=Cephalotrichum gorgonifer TaxID=2041049 RepID=A0AAE8SVG8_9PEZI|nr:related to forkhead protein [Cephalotrichum gorgonifer]
MPATGRRSARREPKKEPATPAVEDSSPSRPAKRRRKADDAGPSTPAAAAATAQSTPPAPIPSTDPVDEDDSALDATSEGDQLVSRVVHHLTSPKDQLIQASKDHANSIHEANKDGVKAYAKIAAQDWTYYVTKLEVNIGRASDPPSDEDSVHIDLGPSKTISRLHAIIYFNTKEEQWFFQVKGRNGAKIDLVPMKAGVSHALKSGEVIEVAGVEMMFVLPTEISHLHIHPTFLQRAGILASDIPSTALSSANQGSDDLPPVPTDARPSRSGAGLQGQQQQPIAPAPANYRRPGTPPSATRRRTTLMQMTSPHPPGSATPFGVPLEIDLSVDENRHIKPQFSYAQMITQAILRTEDGKLNLNGIYTYIMDTYAYYRHQGPYGWQNSIRHNLSLNKAFEKVARSTDEPGKGMKWQIVAEHKEDMVRNAFKGGRGGHRGSSAPSSPSHVNYITLSREPASARKRKLSPIVSPPPRSSLALQSTPDRSRGRRGVPLTSDGSPLPRPRKPVPSAAPSSSIYQPQSPTLASSFFGDENASFVTPAPPRVHPRLAPPSTAPRPSQHMPTSSPAPFWKYADIGSTPLKPPAHFDASPTRRGAALPNSSSPPARPVKSPIQSPSKPAEEEPEIEEEQGFDLARGFQSIGAYHAPVSRGVPIARAREGDL